MGSNSHVIEVTDQTFAEDVLDESYRRPVVVDFWAAWCQPCRMIGPVLERLAEEHGGAFLLAKLDVDTNPQASTALRIQSIPAIKAFRDGRLVNEFIGAIPEESIRKWLESILPTEVDRLVEQAEQAEREGGSEALDRAEGMYRQAREQDPGHRRAALGLARLLTERRALDEAREILEGLRPDPEAERLLAAIEVAGWEAGSPDGESPVARAQRAAAEGRWREALDLFLAEIQSAGEQRDEARDAMLKVFSVLGEDDELTEEYRRKLAAALF